MLSAPPRFNRVVDEDLRIIEFISDIRHCLPVLRPCDRKLHVHRDAFRICIRPRFAAPCFTAVGIHIRAAPGIFPCPASRCRERDHDAPARRGRTVDLLCGHIHQHLPEKLHMGLLLRRELNADDPHTGLRHRIGGGVGKGVYPHLPRLDLV